MAWILRCQCIVLGSISAHQQLLYCVGASQYPVTELATIILDFTNLTAHMFLKNENAQKEINDVTVILKFNVNRTSELLGVLQAKSLCVFRSVWYEVFLYEVPSICSPPTNPGHLNFWNRCWSNSRPLGQDRWSNAWPGGKISV